MSGEASRGQSKRDSARQRIAAKRAAEAAARAQAQRRRRTILGGVAAATAVIVALVVVILVQTQRTAPSAAAAVPPNVDGTVISVGSPDAPVTVDLYEDFQCPNCQAFEVRSGSTLAQSVAAGTVQAHYHGMAFLDTSANHEYSTRALNAAAVVVGTAGSDAFQKFHDLLFANQPPEGGSGLTDDQLVQYAAQAGAGGDAVQHDIRTLKYGDWVKTATDRASKDGVTGTPTVFVGGKRLSDLSANGVAAAISAAKG
jgi:protein-disulfide isomerase